MIICIFILLTLHVQGLKNLCVCMFKWLVLHFCNGNQVCCKMLFSKGRFFEIQSSYEMILYPLHLMKFISASTS